MVVKMKERIMKAKAFVKEKVITVCNGVCSAVRTSVVAVGATVGTAVAATGIGHCGVEIDAGSTANGAMKLLFNGISFAGMVITIAGVVMLVKDMASAASGDTSVQPTSVGKALGLVVAGIACMALKTLITAITGTDPTTASWF